MPELSAHPWIPGTESAQPTRPRDKSGRGSPGEGGRRAGQNDRCLLYPLPQTGIPQKQTSLRALALYGDEGVLESTGRDGGEGDKEGSTYREICFALRSLQIDVALKAEVRRDDSVCWLALNLKKKLKFAITFSGYCRVTPRRKEPRLAAADSISAHCLKYPFVPMTPLPASTYPHPWPGLLWLAHAPRMPPHPTQSPGSKLGVTFLLAKGGSRKQ